MVGKGTDHGQRYDGERDRSWAVVVGNEADMAVEGRQIMGRNMREGRGKS